MRFRNHILFLSFTFYLQSLSLFLIAQTTTENDTGEIPNLIRLPENISGFVTESMPVYKYGEEKGMLIFIAENIKYPHDSVSGKIFVTFIVDTSGNVRRPKFLKGLSTKTNDEALRLVRMLKFNPAMQNGRKVAIDYNFPIDFTPGFYNKYISKKKNK